MLLLIVCSALISGSETAFFSLTPVNIEEIKRNKTSVNESILTLLKRPKRLLATLLIANNFVNISIIILSTFTVDRLIDFESQTTLKFIIQVIVISFLLLLFGELTPKVYATRKATRLASFMALPLLFIQKILNPLNTLLINSTAIIDKKIRWKEQNISVEELSKALEITSQNEKDDEDKKILEGIVKFGNTEVKQIMKSRIDVVALDYEFDFSEVLKQSRESGFSRIPVYAENFDTIKGVLYTKDLLPHLEEKASFKWQPLIRSPFFVPENKKIDDLLKEFQHRKIHLAIVVDEYGGSSGIVTLEDVLEEIVGDISDEFDDDDIHYSKLDENNFVFEGKTPLIDFYRILDVDPALFEEHKGEADSLAGFIIELAGKIPLKMEKINFAHFLFTIEAADKRRVKRIKVTLLDQHESN
jgi:gliding motility-associated protein GldE